MVVCDAASGALLEMEKEAFVRFFTGLLAQNRCSPRPPICRGSFPSAPPGRRRRGGAVWCAARNGRRTNARKRRRTHRQAPSTQSASRFGGKFETEGGCAGPGGKVDVPELSSGPGWEIQEVSRVGAQGVTSKSKLWQRRHNCVVRWLKGARLAHDKAMRARGPEAGAGGAAGVEDKQI